MAQSVIPLYNIMGKQNENWPLSPTMSLLITVLYRLFLSTMIRVGGRVRIRLGPTIQKKINKNIWNTSLY